MRIFLVLLGIFWIIMGVLLVILTDATKEVLRNLVKQKNMKTLSIAALIIGIILLMGSSVVNAPWVTIILGLLGIAKGLFFMLGPEQKTKPFIDWWFNASVGVHKSWGVVTFLLGVLILLIL